MKTVQRSLHWPVFGWIHPRSSKTQMSKRRLLKFVPVWTLEVHLMFSLLRLHRQALELWVQIICNRSFLGFLEVLLHKLLKDWKLPRYCNFILKTSAFLQFYVENVSFLKLSGANPKAKAKAKSKAKAKAAAKGGVSEVTPKTMDDLKSDMGSSSQKNIYSMLESNGVSLASFIAMDIFLRFFAEAWAHIDHQLGAGVAEGKQSSEHFAKLQKAGGRLPWRVSWNKYELVVPKMALYPIVSYCVFTICEPRLKGITTEANANDMKTEVDEEASHHFSIYHVHTSSYMDDIWWYIFIVNHHTTHLQHFWEPSLQVKNLRFVKAQAKAVLTEIRKQQSAAWWARDRCCCCSKFWCHFLEKHLEPCWKVLLKNHGSNIPQILASAVDQSGRDEGDNICQH